jgi:cell wall-associated NlpC family hydrolase
MMIRVRSRGTTRSTPFVVLATLVLCTSLAPATVGAATIAQTKAEIAQLSATLSEQEKTSEITANAYDAAKSQLASINANIVTLQTEETQKRAAIVVTTQKLVIAVVRAYVFGAADAQILALFNQNVTQSDARRVFEDQVIGNLNKIKDTLETQKKSLDATITQVALQRTKAQQQTQAMQSLLAQNIHNENVTRATLTAVTSTLRSEIIAYEVQVGVAAAKTRNVAGEEQAVAAASAVGGQAAANEVLAAIKAATPPVAVGVSGKAAGSAQGMAALRAAESQIGVPYVWGGETPGVGFDCSGLVQWAWAKAGFTIPRTTQSQYPALHHVALNALQPGDLLFYYNLDGDHQIDHVVMYAGSGPWGTDTIIAAAHTGTNVSLAPIFTFGLYGAARP